MTNAMPSCQGGCLCGAVRYAAQGERSDATLCHCRTCRRASAAPAVAWVSFRDENFQVTAGKPVSVSSSDKVQRSFCGRCGTQLTYRHDDYPEWVDITVCSLDTPEELAPTDQTWTSHRLRWMQMLDTMPACERSRGEGQTA